jgi:uncharacterized membrane protein
MVSVLSLLLPIVLSAVFVFIASSIIHMATPWHKQDGADARVDLVGTPVELDAALDAGWIALWPADGRHLRLALAAVK